MSTLPTFVERDIVVEVEFSDNKEVVTLSQLRMTASVHQGQGVYNGELQLAIEGLPLDIMQRLTVIGFIKAQNIGNRITVYAGDSKVGLQMIFKGVIWQAFIDANRQPNVAIHIVAKAAIEEALSTPPATSHKVIKVEQLFEELCNQTNLAFLNLNVALHAENIYLAGSTLDKINTLAAMTGVRFSIHNGVLSIWLDSKKIETEKVIVSPTSPDATLIGYPTFSGNMLELRILFTSRLTYYTDITLESQIEVANGTWRPRQIVHEVQSRTHGGSWFTHLSCDKAIAL